MRRRHFLKLAAAGTAALIVPVAVVAKSRKAQALGDFISIGGDGKIVLTVHRSEMGQGVRTTLATILAEELDLEWSEVSIAQAPGDKRFGNQSTDGSFSVPSSFKPLREAGARARRALLEAAAERWHARVDELTTRAGAVVHSGSKRRASYGDLAIDAAKRPLPVSAEPKARDAWRLLGRDQKRIDQLDIVRGRACYGADRHVPGMRFAVVKRAPFPAMRLARFDATAARALPGVLQIVELKAREAPFNTHAAVAVVASNTWAAIQGAKALEVTWDIDAPIAPTGEVVESWQTFLAEGAEERLKIDSPSEPAHAVRKHTADFETPFAVHAPIEPAACVVDYSPQACHVWAPTQDPQLARALVAKALALPPENVTIDVTLLGGAFGRKAQQDFVVEAVEIAKAIGGPLKLQWTREDEMHHGFFRPATRQRIDAEIDATGKPISWRHTSVFPTLSKVANPRAARHDEWELDGQLNFPYRVARLSCAAHAPDVPVRVAWMRSVSNWQHAFAINSVIDELAVMAGRDAIDFHLELLGEPRVIELTEDDKSTEFKYDTGRLAGTLRRLADEVKTRPAGLVAGIACHRLRYSYVALAAHVERAGDDKVRIAGFDCVVDCGDVLNPQMCRAQVEGGVLFGLSEALAASISWDEHGVLTRNFDGYPVLRMRQAPPVAAHFVDSRQAPTGIGEVATAVVPAALSNAISRALGVRVRRLPLGRYVVD
ncbi:MAG TPA: molybdopterin cofactor-binding domain-containing protein [Rudaea sp.]|nr:molybdopterin cofactor-binding domain-containing protein [Rudaea sp.]